MRRRFFPDFSLSGFHPMGAAPPPKSQTNLAPLSGAEFSKLSPTLVYGPVLRQYFRGNWNLASKDNGLHKLLME